MFILIIIIIYETKLNKIDILNRKKLFLKKVYKN